MEGKFSKSILSLLLLTVLFILSACSEDDTTATEGAKNQQAVSRDTIRVGLNVGFVPWEFMEGDELVGVEVDIIKEILNRMDKDVEWVPTQWNGLFAGLLADKYDVAAAGITIKPDRMKEMDFTSPFYDSDQALTIKNGSGIEGLEDLKGKVIGVESGTTGDQWAQDNKDKYQFSEIKLYNSLQDAMLDLAAGRIEGEISDIPTALYYTKDKDDLKVVHRIITEEQYGLAFKRGDILRDEFNQVLNDMKSDGTMAEIYENWFGEVPPADSSTVTILPIPTLE